MDSFDQCRGLWTPEMDADGGGGQSVYRRREEGGRIIVVMTGVKSRSSKTMNHFSQISTVGTLGRFRDTII